MKKFFILVKKEIKELLTLQMILPLIAVVLVFVFIGKAVNEQVVKSTQSNTEISVLDLDKTNSSKNLQENLRANHFAITLFQDVSIDEALSRTKTNNHKSLIIIPKGYEENLNNKKTTSLPTYNIMTDFSLVGSRSSQNLSMAVTLINENLSKNQIIETLPNIDPDYIKQPVKADDYVVIGSKQAHISPTTVTNYIMSQTTFIPIVLFLVIVLASQLIAISIATEKENKTLEILLSSPISRRSLVAAKLVGTGLVALLTSALYLFGMSNYMNGLTGGTNLNISGETQQAITQLGLTFNGIDYLLLGLSLFFGILVALSMALILGSFAQDTKSAQGVVTPLMLLIMLPYFMTMFLDLNAISPSLKLLVYAIPFSHPFLTAPNLMLNRNLNIWLGIVYMALLFITFVIIAAKIFASDKILTLNLNFKKK